MVWKEAVSFDDAHGDVEVSCLAFSPGGDWLASGGCDGTMKLWDLAARRELLRKSGPNIVTSVIFSADGKRLAWCSSGEAVVIRDLDGKVQVLKLNDKFSTHSLAFAPDGKYLAAGGGVLGKRGRQVNETIVHGHLNVWETATGKELLAVTLERMPVGNVSFSPDGACLAFAASTVMRWDLAGATSTSQEFFAFQPRQSLRNLAVSADGTPLAVGVEDESIRVWNLMNGQEICAMEWQAPSFSFLDFGPNREVLGSDGATVKVWDALTGREIHSLETDGDVCIAAFSHHGTRLAIGYSYGKVEVWMLTD